MNREAFKFFCGFQRVINIIKTKKHAFLRAFIKNTLTGTHTHSHTLTELEPGHRVTGFQIIRVTFSLPDHRLMARPGNIALLYFQLILLHIFYN